MEICYDYIITKEDTLHFVQEKATQAVMKAISRGEEGNSHPVEKLKRLITSELDAMNEYQDLILIIYQESHSMSKELLHSLLKSERNHLGQFERVISEGIKKGFFKPTNVRMTANMIKMLIDTWVIKRWDLKRQGDLARDETRHLGDGVSRNHRAGTAERSGLEE